MPEHEKRAAQIARLLATVSVLGLSVGMFRPAQAEDLTPSQQDKWMPTASAPTAGAPTDASGQASGKRQYQPIQTEKEWGASSPQLDAGSKDANQMKYDSADQLKLDSFSSGGPSNQLGTGSGAGKVNVPPGAADYMKYDTKQGKLDTTGGSGTPNYDAMQGKFKGESVGLPAVQNKLNQPDAIYMKQTMPMTTMPGAGPANTTK